MRLFTIQSKKAFEALMDNGILRIDEALLPNTMAKKYPFIFEEPYAYMREEMEKRIGAPPASVLYPIWAWYKYRGLRSPSKEKLFAEYGEGVLLTLEAEPSAVLLSDFNLYDSYLLHSLPILDDKEMEAYLESADGLNRDKAFASYREGWERIFVPQYDKRVLAAKSYVQATLWQIKREDVLSFEVFGG